MLIILLGIVDNIYVYVAWKGGMERWKKSILVQEDVANIPTGGA